MDVQLPLPNSKTWLGGLKEAGILGSEGSSTQSCSNHNQLDEANTKGCCSVAWFVRCFGVTAFGLLACLVRWFLHLLVGWLG